MPFEVIHDGSVLIQRAVAEIKDEAGKVVGHEVESVLVAAGTVLDESEVAPVIVKLYEEGDAHLRSILKRVRAVAKKAEAKVETLVDEVIKEAKGE